MEAVPLHLKEANEFVAQHHRHNLPTDCWVGLLGGDSCLRIMPGRK